MTEKKRTTEQIERDRSLVANMLARGATKPRIAAIVGELVQGEYEYTLAMASYDIAQVRKAWRNAISENFVDQVSTVLAKIDTLEQAYWDGYNKSLEDAEQITVSADMLASGDDDDTFSARVAGEIKKTITRAKRSGNVAFLQGIQWCISERAKILGLGKKPLYELLEGANDWRRDAEALGVEDPDALLEAVVSQMLSQEGGSSEDVIDAAIALFGEDLDAESETATEADADDEG